MARSYWRPLEAKNGLQPAAYKKIEPQPYSPEEINSVNFLWAWGPQVLEENHSPGRHFEVSLGEKIRSHQARISDLQDNKILHWSCFE